MNSILFVQVLCKFSVYSCFFRTNMLSLVHDKLLAKNTFKDGFLQLPNQGLKT